MEPKGATLEKKPAAPSLGPPPVLMDSLGFLLNKPANEFRERLDALLAPLGLTGKLLSVLKLLDAERGITQHEICVRTRLDRSTMVVLVDALEREGLVERGTKPGDRRAHAVDFTAKGRRVLAQGRKIEEAAQNAFLSGLDAEQRRTLFSLLGRLVQVSYEAGV